MTFEVSFEGMPLITRSLAFIHSLMVSPVEFIPFLSVLLYHLGQIPGRRVHCHTVFKWDMSVILQHRDGLRDNCLVHVGLLWAKQYSGCTVGAKEMLLEWPVF